MRPRFAGRLAAVRYFTTSAWPNHWAAAASGSLARARRSGSYKLPEPVRRLPIRYRRALVFGMHLLCIPVGYALAFVLRLDVSFVAGLPPVYWATVPALTLIRILAYGWFGLYSGWWRYVGITDLANLIKATSISSVLFIGLMFVTGQLRTLPRSIPFLDWGIAVIGFGGIRFLVRYGRESLATRHRETRGSRTIVVGAGNAAAQLLRELHSGSMQELRVVGLVDDDPHKRHLHIHGIPVIGTIADLPVLIRHRYVSRVVLAIPSANRQQIRRIAEQCSASDVQFHIVPSMTELLEGRARLSQLRVVHIEDLLGRAPVSLDLTEINHELKASCVLITGAAGSIGAELVHQVAMLGPARLVLVEQAESPLYYLHIETAREYPDVEIVPVIGDIADTGRMHNVFAQFRPDYVFHAAAYKHVPLMEANMAEAVRNNVLGTISVAQAAAAHGARKFVLISSDKAVNPSSVMGATKRIAERICLGWPTLRGRSTDFRAVRFGNVLGSDGSVVPLFKKQIAAGGPVTVTHPQMTRYFMTIPEAVQLVLRASAAPEAAHRVVMLDMGEPVRIIDLAENLIRLSGLMPYTEMPIVFTGVRPGEKLHEELTGQLEQSLPTSVEKVRIVRTDEPNPHSVERGIEALHATLKSGDEDLLLAAIRELVPECVPPLAAPVEEETSPTTDAPWAPTPPEVVTSTVTGWVRALPAIPAYRSPVDT